MHLRNHSKRPSELQHSSLLNTYTHLPHNPLVYDAYLIRCKSINGVTAYGQNITTATTGTYLRVEITVSIISPAKSIDRVKNQNLHHNGASNATSWALPCRRGGLCCCRSMSELLDGCALEFGSCECREDRGSEGGHFRKPRRCTVCEERIRVIEAECGVNSSFGES